MASGLLAVVIAVSFLAIAPSASAMPCGCPTCIECGGGGSPPTIAIVDVAASDFHTVSGTQGTVSWEVSISDGTLSSTHLICAESGCSVGALSLSGSTYSVTITGLSIDVSSGYTIYATATNEYGSSSTTSSGSFVPTNVAPDPSYVEWNPTYSFSGSCLFYSVSESITPHIDDYQPGDFVYTANAQSGTWTTYDLQAGLSETNAGWCTLYYLDLTSASLSIEFVDSSNTGDNLASWMQVSNTYTIETSSTGQGTYSWNVGVSGSSGGGSVSLGASYQAPTTVTPSYTVQQSNLGNGVFQVSTLSADFPMGGGSNTISAILPIHILDWLIPSNVEFDNIQVVYSWTLNFAACAPSLNYCGNTDTYTLGAELGDFFTVSSAADNTVSEWSFLEPGTVTGSVG